MSEQFKVGEIAEIVADFSGRYPQLVGFQTTIVELPYLQETFPPSSTPMYTGMMPDGKTYAFHPGELRKLRPPREDLQLTSWSECPWQPAGINA